MAKVNLELFKGKKLRDGSHPIMIRITHLKKNKYISTGYSCTELEWDIKSRRPKKPRLRNLVSNKLNDAENVIFELERKKKTIILDEVAKEIKNESSNETVFSFFNGEIESLKKSKKLGNAENYTTVLNRIKKFQSEKDLIFEQINYKWLKEFESWHLSNGNTVGGLSVYMRAIRAVYNKAIKESIAKKELYPFGKGLYEIPSQPTQKRAISKDAIIAIKKLNYAENSTLWHTRNYFLFMFYCRGMNWVDMANLKLSNIRNGRIEYIRIKTMRKNAKSFSIKLEPQINDIIEFYSKNKKMEAYIFPIIHRKKPEDQRKDVKNNLKTFNKYLKIIALDAGIEGNISSYTTRHSWGTIAKKAGVDIATISDAYGHGDMAVTKTYLDSIENEKIDEANSKLIDL